MRAVYNIDSRVQFIVTVALLIEIAGTLTASSTSPRFASLTSFNNAKGQEVHISPAFCLGVVLVLGATGQTGQSIVNGLLKSGEFVSVKLAFTCSTTY